MALAVPFSFGKMETIQMDFILCVCVLLGDIRIVIVDTFYAN